MLERALIARAARPAPTIEVLHVGVVSWDLTAGAQFVRRSLTTLDPDLVIHLTVANDLDDCYGVRGFGALSTFSPQVRERADALVTNEHALRNWGRPGFLTVGLGWEVKQRSVQRAGHLVRLAEALERSGGRYLLLASWGPANSMCERDLAPHLDRSR